MKTQALEHPVPERYLINESALRRSGDDDLTMRKILDVIGRNKWTLLLTMLSLMALAYYLLSRVTPSYDSTAQIMFEGDQGQVVQSGDVAPSVSTDPESLQTQVEIIQSREMGLQAIVQLGLQNRDEFLEVSESSPLLPHAATIKPEPYRVSHEGKEIVVPAVVFENFRKNLTVSHPPDTRIIAIKFEAEDPNVAAKVVNALADNYIQSTVDRKMSVTARTNSLLESQVSELKRKAESSDRLVNDFRLRNGLSETVGTNLIAQQISQLSSQLATIKSERVEAEARHQQVERLVSQGTGISAIEVLNSPVVQKLREDELRLNQEIDDLAREYGPMHPRMVSQQSQLTSTKANLDQEIKRIIRGIRDQVEIARARENSLAQSLSTLTAQINDSKRNEVRLAELEREASANRQLLESFMTRVNETASLVDAGFYRPDASMISRGYPAIEPSFPKVGPTLVLALGGSFLLGLIAVFIKDSVEGSAEGEVQDDAYAGKPDKGAATPSVAQLAPSAPDSHGVNAPVPSSRVSNVSPISTQQSRSQPESIAAFAAPASAAAVTVTAQARKGAVNLVGTVPLSEIGADKGVLTSQYLAKHPANVVLTSLAKDLPEWFGQGNSRQFLLTSSERNAARTSIAIAMASLIAKQGKNVLVLDLDFNEPSLHEAFQINNDKGMIDYLESTTQLEKVVRHDVISGVSYITTGSRRKDPGSIYNQDAVLSAVSHLTKHFDCVMILGAPFLISKEVRGMSRVVDKTIYVMPVKLRQNAKVISELVQWTKQGGKAAGILYTK